MNYTKDKPRVICFFSVLISVLILFSACGIPYVDNQNVKRQYYRNTLELTYFNLVRVQVAHPDKKQRENNMGDNYYMGDQFYFLGKDGEIAYNSLTGDFKKICLIYKTLFILNRNSYGKEFYYVFLLDKYEETGISVWNDPTLDGFEEIKKYYKKYSPEDFVEEYPDSHSFDWELISYD